MFKYEIGTINIYIEPIENEIIKKRIRQVLTWNIRKANFYKIGFYLFSILVIIFNASIPIFNEISEKRVIITIISGIVFFLTSILTFINFKDSWYRYRLTIEIIKNECMKYNCRYGEYATEKREELFFVQIEKIILEERKLWIDNRFKN